MGSTRAPRQGPPIQRVPHGTQDEKLPWKQLAGVAVAGGSEGIVHPGRRWSVGWERGIKPFLGSIIRLADWGQTTEHGRSLGKKLGRMIFRRSSTVVPPDTELEIVCLHVRRLGIDGPKKHGC